MGTNGGAAAASPEELQRRRVEHREFVARFERRLGKVDTSTLAREIEREGFDKSPFFARLKSRLTLSAVLDACYVLDLIRGAVRKTPSAFWDLVTSRLITCWAPVDLETDLEGKFELLAGQLGVPINDVELAWARDIAPFIHIAAGHETPEVTAAVEVLARRDPKDVGYPGLLLTIGADAILTKDNDLREDGGVTTWSFGDAIRMVATHDRGRTALQVQFQTALAFMVGFTILGGATKEAARGLGKLLKFIPAEAWVGVGVGVAALMMFETPRRWVTTHLVDLKRKAGTHWDVFTAVALRAWEVMGPVIEDIHRATSEAEAISEQLPRPPRRLGRIPSSLRERVLSALPVRPKGLTATEVLRTAFPRLCACDVAVLRQQVYRLLEGQPGIVRTSRGHFAWITVPTKRR